MNREKAGIEMISRNCIALRWRMLNRGITKIFDDALRPLGLKASQVNVLVAAWELGTASPSRVCDILQMDASTLSRNVERMRTKGWIEIVPAEDGREQPFRLTPAGRKLLEKTVPHWQRAQDQVRGILGDRLVALLDQAAARLQGARIAE
jgi:DNA-binding MarR family transcriptional regulator